MFRIVLDILTLGINSKKSDDSVFNCKFRFWKSNTKNDNLIETMVIVELYALANITKRPI
jgi:hypothetical protein